MCKCSEYCLESEHHEPSATSRTTAQHIQYVTHRSVSADTIKRRLQQSRMSSRHPLLCLPLTGNHWYLCRQWCDER
ncbi:hypothetical protein TNCV_493341 [Trichonephila clavipes]|nr:hypothetical protein TNCV_493341 [Trichonephila clavipes]